MTEKNQRESMVFYVSFYDAIKDLPPEEFKECACAIMEYGFDGIVPECGGLIKSLFTLIKPQIDKNIKRYQATVENGRKGGAPKGNTNRKKACASTQINHTSTKDEQSSYENNLYDNDNDNDNDYDYDYDNCNANEDYYENDCEKANVNEKVQKEPAKAGSNTLALGEYENVFITGIEMAKLICDLGHDGYEKSVEHLSRYLKRKPDYKSACHYEDLRGWVQDALKEDGKHKGKTEQVEPDIKARLDHFGGIDLEDLFERP